MTVELAGTGPLKILHTVNIDMWRHPSYYKKLRERNKSDRVISERQATASSMRAPGLGHKRQASEDSTANSTRGQVAEPEAASCKHQASSLKHQAVQKK